MVKIDKLSWKEMLVGERLTRAEEKRLIDENKETVELFNRRSLITIVFILSFMFLVLFVCSFFVPGMDKSRPVFTVAMLMPLSVYLLSPLLRKIPILPLGYGFFFITLIFATMSSIRITPTTISIILIFSLVTFPTLFIDYRIRSYSIVTVFTLIYCAAMWKFKEPSLAFEETINMIRFAFVGLALGRLVRVTFLLNMDRKRQLEIKANLDALTQIGNRNAFDNTVGPLKSSPLPVALVICDIDDFKRINDSYGHVVGDEVLRRVAKILDETFRLTDVAVRLGGDEFAIIMNGASIENFDMIKGRLQEINTKLAESAEEGSPSCILSSGVAFSEAGYQDDLYRKADVALYDAKHSNKHKVRMYTEG